MRRIFIAFVLLLWACGSDATPPPPTSSPPPETETTAPATPDTSAAGVTDSPAPAPSEGPNTTEAAPISPEAESPSTAPPTTAPAPAEPDATPALDLVSSDGAVFPPPPNFPQGPISAGLRTDLEAFFGLLEAERRIGPEELVAVASHDEVRIAWILADVLRFVNAPDVVADIGARLQNLLGEDAFSGAGPDLWKNVTNLLIAWDVPAFAEYREYKGRLFTLVEPKWEPFFSDPEATIDWRWLSWGGVFIDDRPLGDTAPCPRGCIPALDDPVVTPASEGDWYPDDAVVFGVTVNGESRAYPKNQMEVHEMVNDTLGGRRIGMPYCTLCGSAQAYLTDQVPEDATTPVLRTSGLLSRSNKVMYDLNTGSVFDTFAGEALSGPLREKGVRLAQTTVVSSTWGAWKEAHPDTTILAADGGLGRSYPDDPLRGRDDQGPIFPVGDVDPRLAVQEQVVGVELADGTTIAFSRDAALLAIRAGEEVSAAGVRLVQDGDGLRAVSMSDGSAISSHQAFWFAWSQFHPDTILWSSHPS